MDDNRETRFLMLSLYERRHVHGRKQHCHIQVDSTWKDASSLVLAIASELASNPKCDKPLELANERQNVTPREHEVLVLVAQGFTNTEIAEQLSISPRTAELHRFRLQRKLGVKTPIDLAKYVLRAGLIPM
jgi:DNA-binding NarL/FixJ family response regulator